MNIINKRFEELKLSEYQSHMYMTRPKCETYMAKVFNRKRNFIDASFAIHLITVVNLLEIEGNASLTGIDLQHSCIGSENAKHVARGISFSASLTSIDLSWNELGDVGVKHIAEGISVSASLTSINIGFNCIGKVMALKLVEILKKKQMVSVGLASCSLGVVGAQAVADYISASALLTSIDVSHNNIDGDAAQQLATVVLEKLSLENFCSIPLRKLRTDTVTELDLSRKGVGVSESLVLAHFLRVNASLTNINLRRNKLGDEGAKYIAKAIAFSTSLTSIDLSSNQLGDESAIHIAVGFSLSASLTSIDLSCNQLGDEGAKYIAGGISLSASLTTADLSHSFLGANATQGLRNAVIHRAGFTLKL